MSFEQNRLAWPGVNDVCGAARHAGGPAAYGQVYGGLKRPSRVTLVTSSDPTGLWSPDGAKRAHDVPGARVDPTRGRLGRSMGAEAWT